MMKFMVFALTAMAALSAVLGAPAEEFEPLEIGKAIEGPEGQQLEDTEDHPRFRRVTCDLLSFGGVVGDSACAANCLSMGKAGGSCNGGVCQCRKTSFKDLWDKRFG